MKFCCAKLGNIQGGLQRQSRLMPLPGSIYKIKKVHFLAFLRKAIKKDLLLDFTQEKGPLFSVSTQSDE